MQTRAGLIIGWICALLVAAFNLFAAIMKFVPVTPGSPGDIFATEVGMKGLEYQLGVLELIIVVLFVIPRTSTVGFASRRKQPISNSESHSSQYHASLSTRC